MNDLFRQGVEALKLDDKVKARKLLAQVVKDDPKNKRAWLWLSQAVEKEQQQITCFQKVLEIDPQNESAKRGLHHIQRKRQEALDQSTGQLSEVSPFDSKVLAVSEPIVRKDKDFKTNESEKKIPLWVVVIVSVCILALCGMSLIISSIGEIGVENEPRTVSTQNGTFLVPGNGFIDGRGLDATPPLTIMEVRVWDSVRLDRRALCKISHGTAVQILDFKQDPDVSEEWYHFQVQSGSCKGWVTWWFVNTQRFEPIGDRIYD